MQIKELTTISELIDARFNGRKLLCVTTLNDLNDIDNYDNVYVIDEQEERKENKIPYLESEVSTLREIIQKLKENERIDAETIRQLKENAEADAETIEKQDDDIEDKDAELTKLRAEVTSLRTQLERMKPEPRQADEDHTKLEALYQNGTSVQMDNLTDISGFKVVEVKKGDRGKQKTLLDPEKTAIDEDEAAEIWDGEKAKAYFEECKSLNKTAKHFGVSWYTCKKRLEAMGVVAE